MEKLCKSALREVVREVLDGLLEDDDFIELLKERMKSSPVPPMIFGGLAWIYLIGIPVPG